MAIILVADDEAVVTRSISALLDLEGDYVVLEFQSPTEALEAISRRVPDVGNSI